MHKLPRLQKHCFHYIRSKLSRDETRLSTATQPLTVCAVTGSILGFVVVVVVVCFSPFFSFILIVSVNILTDVARNMYDIIPD